MSKFRLLATALLVALCTGFYSCGGDDEEEPLTEIKDESNDDIQFLEELLEKYPDVNCVFNMLYENESSTGIFLSGIRNKHLWFGLFDKTTKKQVFEWEDAAITNEIIKLYEGYGEYKEVRIEKVFPISCIKKTSSGYILIWMFQYNFNDFNLLPSDIRENQMETYRIVFVSNGKSQSVSLTNSEYSNLIIKDWYNESIIIGKSCYSYKGDLIYSSPIDEGMEIKGAPISYEEGIYTEGSSIIRYNYKEGMETWSTNIKPSFEVPSNARSLISTLDNSTNIWKCRIDYTFYDGTKKDYTFSINIDNGELYSDAGTTKADYCTYTFDKANNILKGKYINSGNSYDMIITKQTATQADFKWDEEGDGRKMVTIHCTKIP